MNILIREDYLDVIDALPEDQQGDFLLALVKFGTKGIEPDKDSPWYAVFVAMRPRIEMGIKRALAGKKGGQQNVENQEALKEEAKRETEGKEDTSHKQSSSKQEANTKQTASKSEANIKQSLSKQEANVKQTSSEHTFASNLLSRGEGEGECECEKDPPPKIPPSQPKDPPQKPPPYEKIVSYLNKACETSYRSTSKKTRSLINARFREGFNFNDFMQVIDTKSEEWLADAKMRVFLRPETLFGTKFESYLNQPKPRKEREYNEYA